MKARRAPLDAQRITEILEAGHANVESPPGEGLRDRKKRRLRQRISNVATGLFLAEGFDEVSVARVAVVAEVSEQTVFNYFPTKELMLFDRAEALTAAIAGAVRDRSRGLLADSVLPELMSSALPREWPAGVEETEALALLGRFAEVSTASPTLRGATYLAAEPFVDVVSQALAERISAEPEAPEVRLTATVLAGLVLARLQAFQRHALVASSIDGLQRAIEEDIRRAMLVARPTLDAVDRLLEELPSS